MFGASSKLASVMEFGFNRQTAPIKAKFHYAIQLANQLANQLASWFASWIA